MTQEAIRQIRLNLNTVIGQMLQQMPREFSSNEFLEYYKDHFPNEYAEALNNADGYRDLHRWVARHYLHGLRREGLLEIVGRNQPASTWAHRPTRNARWRIL